MFRIGLCFIAFWLSAQVVRAQSDGRDVQGQDADRLTAAEACLAQSIDAIRLACFDAALSYNQDRSELANDGDGDGWTLVTAKDAFSERDTSYVFLESDQASRRGADAPRTLVLRCDGNGGFETYVISDGYLGGRDGRVPVRYRFGEEPPISERWFESTDGQAAFLPEGYRDFLNGLSSRADFIFEMTDFRGSTNLAKFVGLDKNASVLDFIQSGCRQ